MSATTRLLFKPCMAYKKAYKTSEMETVTLRNRTADGTDVKRRCLVFTGDEGVEGLIQTKTRFNSVAHALQLEEGPELFDNFEQVLSDNAETRWQNLVADIADDDRTDVRFEDEYQNLLDSYATNRGRDYMRDYLTSAAVWKPHDMECAEHKERLTTLIKYTNMLSGTQDQIEANDEKHIVFKSFPDKWQQAYILSGHNYMTQTLDEIVQYMSNKKIEQDQKERDDRRRSARQPYRESRNSRYPSRFSQNTSYHPYGNNMQRNSNRFQFGNPSGRFASRFTHGGRGNGGRGFDRTGRGRFPNRNFYQQNHYNNHYINTNGRVPYNPGMGGRVANGRVANTNRDGSAQNFFTQRGRRNDSGHRSRGNQARAAHQIDVHHFDSISPPQEYYQAEEPGNNLDSQCEEYYPDEQYPAEQNLSGWY